MPMSDTFSRSEIITGVARRPRFTAEQKLAVVAETSLISSPRVIAAHSSITKQERPAAVTRGRCSFGATDDSPYLQDHRPIWHACGRMALCLHAIVFVLTPGTHLPFASRWKFAPQSPNANAGGTAKDSAVGRTTAPSNASQNFFINAPPSDRFE